MMILSIFSFILFPTFLIEFHSVLLAKNKVIKEEIIMSKNPKSIADQINQLEAENKRLYEYEKLFNKAVKISFGYDTKKINEILKKYEESELN